MVTLNKFGAFNDTFYFAVPYQHHQNRLTWNVTVGALDKVTHLIIIAETAQEAAHSAIGVYRKILEEEIRKESEKEKADETPISSEQTFKME